MSKIVFLADNLAEVEGSGGIDKIRSLTGFNIVEIKERILDKFPLAEFVLYEDVYDKVVKEMKPWLNLAQQNKFKVSIYLLEPDQDFSDVTNLEDFVIGADELLNQL